MTIFASYQESQYMSQYFSAFHKLKQGRAVIYWPCRRKQPWVHVKHKVRHPIPLPSTILCKAFIKNIVGRKVYITVSITSGDEQFGNLDEHEEIVEYVRGDTLFIAFKEC